MPAEVEADDEDEDEVEAEGGGGGGGVRRVVMVEGREECLKWRCLESFCRRCDWARACREMSCIC